jgi:signal peptidase II
MPLGLILGGGVGNLIDRLLLGHVVDFISLHYQSWYWPAFNLADSAITLGAGWWLLSAFFSSASPPEKAPVS